MRSDELKKNIPKLNSKLFMPKQNLDCTYRVSRKKVYPFAANLENIRYKDLAHLSHTI